VRRKDAPGSWAVRHRKLDAPYGYRLDRKASWTDPEMIRFIGFQGKRSIEALFDPALNSILLAWNVLGRRFGQEFWKVFCHGVNEADRPYPEAAGRPAGSIGGDWRSTLRATPTLPALSAFF